VHSTIDFLARHGYWVVFLTVLGEQLGVPIPAVPVLVAVGALAGFGKLSILISAALAVIACLISDSVWFWLGRKKGMSVLKLLCKISLEPDSCVSIARDWFRKRGSSALLFAKFIPGFSTAAPPMAGVNKMSLGRFLVFDGLGSLAWVGVAMTLGYLFRNQLESVMDSMNKMGSWLGTLIVGALGAYIGIKWYQRHRLIHHFLMSRISPEELQERTQSGDPLAVVDLRNAREIEEIGSKIPGAILFSLSDLEQRHEEIPRDREIVLYCS
jgi:membrane protein DedA with SNARE-associated domain